MQFPKIPLPSGCKEHDIPGYRCPAFYRISGGGYPGGVGGKTTRHFFTVRSRKKKSLSAFRNIPPPWPWEHKRRDVRRDHTQHKHKYSQKIRWNLQAQMQIPDINTLRDLTIFKMCSVLFAWINTAKTVHNFKDPRRNKGTFQN